MRTRVAAWMREHGPRLLGLAEMFAEGPTEAQDILQETWIIAFKKGGDLDPELDEVGAWLFQVTLNLGRDHVRKRKRRAALASRMPIPMRAARPPTIQEELDRAGLWRAVAKLPEKQRAVLTLRLLSDKSIDDTAASLGVTRGTVKKNLHEALKKLRLQVDDKCLKYTTGTA